MPATISDWQGLASEQLAQLDTPFAKHWEQWQALAAQRLASDPPMAAWYPSKATVQEANLTSFMRAVNQPDYSSLHAWSVSDREAFWSAALEDLGVTFHTSPSRILATADHPDEVVWLPGARLNAAAQCFHAPPERTAIIQRSESGEEHALTYGELEARVRRLAAGFCAHGLRPGDGVALYMPMTIDCVVAYLATVWAGLHVVSIPDSFAPDEVATRLRLGNARLLLTVKAFSRGGKEVPMAPKALQAAQAVGSVEVVSVGAAEGCLDLQVIEEAGQETGSMEAVAADPYETTNVLFSSGTTGEPKAIPWNHLTPLKAAMDGRFHQDIHGHDVVAWPTNIGWMMGPWLIYATFINQATMMLYVGAPVGDGFLAWVSDSKTSVLGLVPALVRSWKATSETTSDLSGVRVFSSTGEASNVRDYLWLMSRARYQAPIIEYCGGTEIGGGHVTGSVLQAQSPATFSTPALGLDFVVLDDAGTEVAAGQHGQIWLRPPSIGLSQRLLNRDHGREYYDDCPADPAGVGALRRHGDEMHVLPGGYYAAGGRADDTMNLGGIKVSSVELEAAMDGDDRVLETAAVAIQPAGGGAEQLVVFAVTKNAGSQSVEAAGLKAGLQERIKKKLNPLFRIHDLVLVEKLPRTASNKVMRRVLRDHYLAPRKRVP